MKVRKAQSRPILFAYNPRDDLCSFLHLHLGSCYGSSICVAFHNGLELAVWDIKLKIPIK